MHSEKLTEKIIYQPTNRFNRRNKSDQTTDNKVTNKTMILMQSNICKTGNQLGDANKPLQWLFQWTSLNNFHLFSAWKGDVFQFRQKKCSNSNKSIGFFFKNEILFKLLIQCPRCDPKKMKITVWIIYSLTNIDFGIGHNYWEIWYFCKLIWII